MGSVPEVVAVNMRRAGVSLGLLVALWGTGCVPGQLTINVRAAPNTNQSRPVYMVVRTVDPKAYLSQSYDEVVSKVVSPDDAVLHSSVVYPGKTRQVSVRVPQALPVAVSFLFTSPDGAWQTLLDAMVPGTVDIELEGSRIQEGGSTLSNPPPEQAPQQHLPALEVGASAGK
jgi:hypothetical protein